ncbi:MAG: hypothetical protein A2Y94_13965 [Caldithrix sp. RBG_13_44_9]|nr:MAG: hypothetical protein A2Y94_13965 [Caldithrix sp. RBG_13_44_9]
MSKDCLNSYITSDVYEAAFFLLRTKGECRPLILHDFGKNEALFSYKNIDMSLPMEYRKSDVCKFKPILIALKREMFRILDKKDKPTQTDINEKGENRDEKRQGA